MLVCNSCDLFNINYFRVWISKCLYLNGFGVILNCSFNLFIVERIYKCCLNAIIRKRMCQKIVWKGEIYLSGTDIVGDVATI